MAKNIQIASKKMSRLQKSLLVKMRHLSTINLNSVRRAFKNNQLSMINNSPWSSFTLSENDMKIIQQVKHLTGEVIALRIKKKTGKKRRHERRSAHHAVQPSTDDSLAA